VSGTYSFRSVELQAQMEMIRAARRVTPEEEVSDPELTAMTTSLINRKVTSWEQTRGMEDKDLLLIRNIGEGRLLRIRDIESRLGLRDRQLTIEDM
jgi:hypothetical protein